MQPNALLLATCYMRSQQTYRAYSVLKGALLALLHASTTRSVFSQLGITTRLALQAKAPHSVATSSLLPALSC